jgi:hypothetical protein
LHRRRRIIASEGIIMNDHETLIDDLEKKFPALADIAFNAARERTLASGQSVLESEAGVIYEVFPDGSRKVVKRIEPPTPIPNGATAIIR